jgi:hypothetical protein
VMVDSTNTNVTGIGGQMTTLADCTTRTFSPTIISYADVMSGLLIQDNPDFTTLTADLGYSLFSGTGAVNPQMRIQLSADPTFWPLFPDFPRIVFSLSGRTAGNGIYVSPALTGTPSADLAPTPIAARPTQPAAGVETFRTRLTPSTRLRSASERLTSATMVPSFNPSLAGRASIVGDRTQRFARFAIPSLLRR